ncbi:DUF423 domain-containing protein [Bradyrhizobium cenepequi]|uniref:DUF423 domain-containing protein n=1 Tax=Bradyrhizobium cenepequi TaxID=2821403 RepID=UPI001CE3990E|nr:DUF423 domain-containing protein [Bradyrhizobium cenepequi]MCA6111629.1 DUF423 domain-containing protein [Bradyrhizobium cenepequi]
MTSLPRILLVLAGIMGACGVMLAGASAHLPDATRLAAASSMLLFHASAVLGTVALSDRGLLNRAIGTIAAVGFVIGPSLFAGDLGLRQYAGYGLFRLASPIGGTLSIASWLVLAMAATWPQRGKP